MSAKRKLDAEVDHREYNHKRHSREAESTSLLIHYLSKVISFSRPFSRTINNNRQKKMVQVPFKRSRGRLLDKIQTFDLTGLVKLLLIFKVIKIHRL